MQILCADGSIVLEVISSDPKAGTVHARCLNNATLGYVLLHWHQVQSISTLRVLSATNFLIFRERKNVNLPGVIVDLPTLTKKDEDDLVNWGIPNDIDFIAASFVRKGQDLENIRKVSSKLSVLRLSPPAAHLHSEFILAITLKQSFYRQSCRRVQQSCFFNACIAMECSTQLHDLTFHFRKGTAVSPCFPCHIA